MTSADLRVDGNAAAGLLREIFPVEMTVTWTTCAHCGAEGQVGTLVVFVQAPGVVFRCPGCEGVMIRIVRGRDRLFVDMSGVRCLQVPAED